MFEGVPRSKSESISQEGKGSLEGQIRSSEYTTNLSIEP
jgi:hypothetical protein